MNCVATCFVLYDRPTQANTKSASRVNLEEKVLVDLADVQHNFMKRLLNEAQ